ALTQKAFEAFLMQNIALACQRKRDTTLHSHTLPSWWRYTACGHCIQPLAQSYQRATHRKELTMSCFSHRLIAAAVVAALSLPVLAQTSAPVQTAPDTAQAEPGQRMQRDPQMRRQAPDRAKMQERMAQRMAAFKEKLQLSPT